MRCVCAVDRGGGIYRNSSQKENEEKKKKKIRKQHAEIEEKTYKTQLLLLLIMKDMMDQLMREYIAVQLRTTRLGRTHLYYNRNDQRGGR